MVGLEFELCKLTCSASQAGYQRFFPAQFEDQRKVIGSQLGPERGVFGGDGLRARGCGSVRRRCGLGDVGTPRWFDGLGLHARGRKQREHRDEESARRPHVALIGVMPGAPPIFPEW